MYKLINKTISRVLRSPQYLILFVSGICWMRCRHCWYNEEWKDANLQHNQMTFDELSRLAESIPFLHFLSLTGGEAFVRRDIVEVAEMFARKTRLNRYQIPTSGFMTDNIVKATEGILKVNPGIPFRVDVSLDGPEAVHEEVRNIQGGFKNAIATIKALNQLKKRYDYFDVGVITTVSNQNQHAVEETGAIVEKVNPDGEWMVNITRGKPRDPCAIDVDVKNYIQAHQLIDQRIAEGRYKGHGGHLLAQWLSAKNAARRQAILKILKGEMRGGGCAAGSLGGVIFNDGAVFPCEMLEHSLGNIRDYDFDLPRIWNSRRADEIRDLIQDTRCICTQECFLSVSMLIQPRHWPNIVKERIKLMKTTSVEA